MTVVTPCKFRPAPSSRSRRVAVHRRNARRFLMRTLAKVRTEMSLHVLAYNMKRVIRLLATAALIKAMQA